MLDLGAGVGDDLWDSGEDLWDSGDHPWDMFLQSGAAHSEFAGNPKATTKEHAKRVNLNNNYYLFIKNLIINS